MSLRQRYPTKGDGATIGSHKLKGETMRKHEAAAVALALLAMAGAAKLLMLLNAAA